MDLEKIKKQNDKLRRQNEKLRDRVKELEEKLDVAKNWMEKEVKSQVKKIAKKEVKEIKKEMTKDTKKALSSWNTKKAITNSITNYFWEIMLLNIPESVVENIISAELSYFNLEQNPSSDGVWVITSYHKAIDTLVEAYITKLYRRFAKKTWQTILRTNDPLEKTFHSVVNKWYILWIWRIYHMLKLVRRELEIYDYWKCFLEFLEKYDYIWKTLLSQNFFDKLEVIVNSEALWKKRHIWKMTFEETKRARELLIWDFEDKQSILYKLAELWSIEI